MKAAYITQPGAPESILFGELETPVPQSDQILVKINAVSVNPIDTYIRSGLIPMQLPNPFIVGCDFSGMVTSIGTQVTRFKIGDRVWGSNQGLLGRQGTFSEYAAVDEMFAYPIPESVADEDAAALALVGITAHLGLVQEARLQAGETLMVNGGAGGVGSVVIQMGKAIGARVIATAGNDERVERCLQLGADCAVNYRSNDVDPMLKEFAPEGVNVFWETSRVPDFHATIGRLAERGRMIVMAGRDATPEFPVGPFYVKGCRLHGFAMFKASSEEQQEAARDMNSWMSKGRLRSNISQRFPLSETAVAHRLQEDNTIKCAGTLAGKIVVTV
ncbi:MAG TPA: NADPH:quinone reductase [Verrucomicrobiales bacterium]|nr:NADPH:quinone reductase [Verrucomicrobiales bacterium]HIL70833.1 NADPH:quinone reductase [Verrucomicrobiota bacterium]